MADWISEPPAIFFASLLACALPLMLGLLIGRGAARHQAITALGGAALGLTLLGVWLYVTARALQVSGIADGLAGVGEFLLGIFLSILGFVLACFGCGVALATTRRMGHHQWFVVLLAASLLPLLAALATFDYAVLVVARLSPGQPATMHVLDLMFLLAPIGTVALVAYGIYGQIAARRSPTSEAV